MGKQKNSTRLETDPAVTWDANLAGLTSNYDFKISSDLLRSSHHFKFATCYQPKPARPRLTGACLGTSIVKTRVLHTD